MNNDNFNLNPEQLQEFVERLQKQTEQPCSFSGNCYKEALRNIVSASPHPCSLGTSKLCSEFYIRQTGEIK